MKKPNQKVKISPRDFFLYLGVMAGLYISVISLLTLLFQYINVLFPDELSFGDYYSPMRFAIASLIIVFPLYIFLTKILNQDLRQNPWKKDLSIRKWLIYLTLFVAGATVVIDLIALVNTFLNGELTTRFALKFLAILVVVSSTFGYYLYDLKGRWEDDAIMARIIAGIAGLLVLAAVGAGFFVIGSPQTQRLIKFDEQKVNDLRAIQFRIIDYWRLKQRLPEKLEDLQDPISGFKAPLGPQTQKPYVYKPISDLSFQLCADFNLASRSRGSRGRRPRPVFDNGLLPEDNWQHDQGEVCFERTIDPDLFPPVQPKPGGLD